MNELLKKKVSLCDQQQAIVDAALQANRAMTDDEQAAFDKLQGEIEALNATIKRAEQIASHQNELNQPADNKYRPIFGGPVAADKLDDGGFKNLGEFIDAVRFGDPKGRLQKLGKNQNQGNGFQVPEAFRSMLLPRAEWTTAPGSSGAAIPQQFDPNVLMLRPETSIVRPRAQVIPPGEAPDALITMPAFKQGAEGVFGGVAVDWIAEGAEKPETSGSLEEVALQPKEVAAHTVVTDKLLRNWTAASTFISNLLRSAMNAAEDMAFLTGAAVGRPTGVLTGAGAIAVNRATANKVGFLDVVNMMASLLPDSAESAIWVANQSLLPQLVTLKDDNGNLIFIQGDATRGIPSTLLGLPVRFTGRTAPLGSKGDLMLVDLFYYLIKDGSGPYVAASEHVLFRQNKTVIKAFWNVDGKPWVPAPLTLEDGVTKVSPYVVLDVPKG